MSVQYFDGAGSPISEVHTVIESGHEFDLTAA
jgi:hypothetical protein